MLKVAHFVEYAPHRAGIYETTREVAWAQREHLSWDARIIDITSVVKKGMESKSDGEDRGVPIVGYDWSSKADVHFLHSGIPSNLQGTRPMFYFAHGLPEYIFYSQMMVELHPDEGIRKQRLERTPFGGSWALITDIGKREWMKGAITLWERHAPYLEPYFGNVIQANHFCDLNDFTPEGDKIKFGYSTEGEKLEFGRPADEGGLNIVFADTWRYTAFKDPFQVLHGARKFCQETGSRIHLCSVPMNEVQLNRHPWNAIIVDGVSDGLKHTVGDFRGYKDDMASIHRAADLLITPSCDDTRTVLEASACGCPVLARHGARGATYHCRIEDPADMYSALKRIHSQLSKPEKAAQVRAKARKTAETFSLEDAVRKMEAGMLKVL